MRSLPAGPCWRYAPMSTGGWTALVLSPDMKLPTAMRLKESRRVPMWNGTIECRLFRFDMVSGSARDKASTAPGNEP